MAPVVWDADAEGEDGPEGESDTHVTAETSTRATTTTTSTTICTTTTTKDTTKGMTCQDATSESSNGNKSAPFKLKGSDHSNAVCAPAPAPYSLTASQTLNPADAQKLGNSEESQSSWKIRQKPSRPQLDSGKLLTFRFVHSLPAKEGKNKSKTVSLSVFGCRFGLHLGIVIGNAG